MKIIIVNCKSKKHKTTQPTPAEDVYSASYAFVPQKEFAKLVYDDQYIISTKYGLINFVEPIEYYDKVLFTTGKGHNKLKTKGDWNKEEKKNWINQIKLEINKLLEDKNVERIDLHLNTSYWNVIKDEFINNPRIKFVSQQRNSPIVKNKYEQAIKLYNGFNLDECLNLISTIKDEKEETAKYFYHPEDEQIFGKARDVWKKYPYVDLGGLHRVSMNKANQHRGWVIKKSLLPLLKKNSGYKQWRLKK